MTIQRAPRPFPFGQEQLCKWAEVKAWTFPGLSCQGKREGVRGAFPTNEGPEMCPSRGLLPLFEKEVLKMKRGQTGKSQNKLQALTTVLKPQPCCAFRCYIFPFNGEILQALRSTYHGQVLCRCCGGRRSSGRPRPSVRQAKGTQVGVTSLTPGEVRWTGWLLLEGEALDPDPWDEESPERVESGNIRLRTGRANTHWKTISWCLWFPLIQFPQNDKIIYRFSGCQRLRMEGLCVERSGCGYKGQHKGLRHWWECSALLLYYVSANTLVCDIMMWHSCGKCHH